MCLPLVPILNQTNPYHALKSSFFIQFQYYPPISSWVLHIASFLQVSQPTPCMHLFSFLFVAYAPPMSSSLIGFDGSNNTWWGAQTMKLRIMQFCAASYYFLAPREKYHLWQLILEHNSAYPSLTVKDSVSHPCTTVFNIRVLCSNLY